MATGVTHNIGAELKETGGFNGCFKKQIVKCAHFRFKGRLIVNPTVSSLVIKARGHVPPLRSLRANRPAST